MNCGLDYGTSNTEVGVWRADGPLMAPLDGEDRSMPSAMYTQRAATAPTGIDFQELQDRISRAKAAQLRETKKVGNNGRRIVELTDVQLRSMELGRMRREAAVSDATRHQGQSLSEAISTSEGDMFGHAAIEEHILSPEDGFFFKSPKTFLGAELRDEQLEMFTEIVTRMIAHVKALAEKWSGDAFRQVVMGRPVNFHGTRGEEGNAQATAILTRAAVACGFDTVEFFYEPVAAAIDYERSLSVDKLVLVVDLGGGTADFSMVLVGPSVRHKLDRATSVLGYCGDRIGGNDLDIKLAFMEIMNEFGRQARHRDGLPVPATLFWDAVSTNNIPSQARFRRSGRQIEALLASVDQPEKFRRLEIVHEKRLSHRIVQSAELAKIHLSDHDNSVVPMGYVEDEFSIQISRTQFANVIERELQRFRRLIDECKMQAGCEPDVIYVTGGTAKSPVVRAFIEETCPGVPIIIGDLFGSVASGLATWANRIYGGQVTKM